MGDEATRARGSAFRETLETLPAGALRTETLKRGGEIGAEAVPAYLDHLARAERRRDAGEATLIRYTLTRMVLGTNIAKWLGPRELLSIYRAMLGRTEQSATRCLAKCVQALQRERRTVTEPIFRELGVEEWLLARWDQALERNDHDDLWSQTGVWLCGPQEDAAAKLADALMLSPEDERFIRILEVIDRRLDDLQTAMQKRPDLARWTEERTLVFIRQQPMNPRIPVLAGMLGVSADSLRQRTMSTR